MSASFAERLRARERLVGTIVTLAAPEVAEVLSGAGLDWLFVDTEHAPLDMLAAQRLLAAARIPCVVRVADGHEATVKRALDIGAAGIVVPMVNSAAQARSAVQFAKYPPLGVRGVGIVRAQGYGFGFADYVRTANERTAVIVQCEHVVAVEAIDAIVAVDGVDAVFVGPYDLSGSLGRLGDVEHPEVLAAIATVRDACARAGRALGIYVADAARAQACAAQGYTLLAVGIDAQLLGAAARGIVAALA
ncbi:MAG: aldolase/citrate lyase family protein [Burkholderiales bacterium]|nr:aldolase/citrate lyase family protein [Burkholderiales bacterium]